jgi:Fe-S-cluster-containing dehydrogenase component/DMSO reductase anchor subunit
MVAGLLQRLLAEQGELTAVERFSRAHDRGALPGEEAGGRYRDLLPATPPGPGQQYAFAVDLDVCSGCKACVTACHSLNGLEPDETWRSVGLISGGSADDPFQQSVTAACHHCLEPACLSGCPVAAYEKDPLTGIVKHLDDQCIGCTYCVLMCPYDVPRYSRSKGIVRKCDMCAGRLASNEAPACVQGCPNQAIRITVVSEEEVVEASEGRAFLPAAPDPALTLPTTIYRGKRSMPRNALPADHHAVRPQDAHPPLVVMLVLTQLSVGVFAAGQVMQLSPGAPLGRLQLVQAGVALLPGLCALAASLFHLGRPMLAWRALLGLRTSWLSREIAAFGLFAGLACAHAALLWRGISLPALGMAVAGAGLAGVWSSVNVYAATRRECWRGPVTGAKFFGTTAVLGIATVLAASLVAAWFTAGVSPHQVAGGVAPGLCAALAIASAGKLGWELYQLLHLRDRRQSVARRAALLLVGELRVVAGMRFALGIFGGLLLPLLYLAVHRGSNIGPLFLTAVALIAAAAVLAGELLERHLFFVASAAPRMPGALP